MENTHDGRRDAEERDRKSGRHELGNVRISTIMTTEVVSLAPETPLVDAARLLVERSIGGAPVVDENGSPLGFLSKTDLARVASVGATPRDITVREAMTPVALTAPASALLHDVADVMVRAGVHRILIVDAHGRPAGILTSSDVLRWIAGSGR